MLCVAFAMNVGCLNLQGLMNATQSPTSAFVPPAYVRRLRFDRIARWGKQLTLVLCVVLRACSTI